MLQQIIVLLIILVFYQRVIKQRRKNLMSQNEFLFWTFFWGLSAILVLFIKKLDLLAQSIGLTASGIDILIYSSILVIFYFIFRLRLRMEKIEKEITKIIREKALEKK